MTISYYDRQKRERVSKSTVEVHIEGNEVVFLNSGEYDRIPIEDLYSVRAN